MDRIGVIEQVGAWYKAALAKGVAGCVEEFRAMRTYVPPNVSQLLLTF